MGRGFGGGRCLAQEGFGWLLKAYPELLDKQICIVICPPPSHATPILHLCPQLLSLGSHSCQARPMSLQLGDAL